MFEKGNTFVRGGRKDLRRKRLGWGEVEKTNRVFERNFSCIGVLLSSVLILICVMSVKYVLLLELDVHYFDQ